MCDPVSGPFHSFLEGQLSSVVHEVEFENKVSNDFTCMATGKAYLSKQVEAVQLWCKFLSLKKPDWSMSQGGLGSELHNYF